MIGYTYVADSFCGLSPIESISDHLSAAIDECNQQSDCGCFYDYFGDGNYVLRRGRITKDMEREGFCSWVRLRNII